MNFAHTRPYLTLMNPHVSHQIRALEAVVEVKLEPPTKEKEMVEVKNPNNNGRTGQAVMLARLYML